MSERAPTNADIMSRLAEMDKQVQILQRGQDSLVRRVDKLEGRWDTVKELLVKVLGRVDDQGQRTAELVESHKELTKQIGELACSPTRRKE